MTVILRTHKNPNAIEQHKKFFHCYKKKSLMNVASLMQGVKRNTKVPHFRYKIKKKKIYGPCVSLETCGEGGTGVPRKVSSRTDFSPLTWLSYPLSLSIWQVTRPKETVAWFSALWQPWSPRVLVREPGPLFLPFPVDPRLSACSRSSGCPQRAGVAGGWAWASSPSVASLH